MAEVVGTVASVAQLVQLSGALLAGGYNFLSKVARAPSEIRSLLTETAAVNSLLAQLQQIADTSPKAAADDALQALERVGVFQECQSTLKSIERALAKCEQVNGQDAKNFGRKLMWPFKEKETKDALQRLHHMRGLLANAIEANCASAIRRIETEQGLISDEVKNMSEQLRAQMSREETQKVIPWVCPTPSDGAHASLASAMSRHIPGTGEWLLHSKEFQDWKDSDSGTMWITGLPGAGKTLLCASIIRHVQQLCTDTTTIVYFFCDHRDHAKMTHDNFASSVARQMMEASPLCLDEGRSLYNEKSREGSRPFQSDDYLSLICSSLGHLQDVFILLDALDESTEGDSIARSLAKIHESQKGAGCRIRILLTSRFDALIQGRYPNLATTHVILAENMRPDIQHYVAEELQARVAKGVLKVRNKDILSSIRQQVVLRAGTMLQARLKIDYICTAKSDKEIKIIVQNLPHGLGHTYEALLCDIATRYPTRIEEVQKLFRCLITAATPLTAPELAEILAMQPDERDLDHDAVVTDPYDVLEPISTLIRIESFENQRSVIRLCHFTLEDYLTSTTIQESPASLFYVSESEAETWMADICLQHLTMETFNAPLDYGLDLDLDQDYAFRTYAALNWFNHASALVYRLHLDDPSRPALGRFLDAEEGPPCYKRWQSLIAKILPNAEFLDYSPTCMCIWAELHVTARELCQRLPNMDYHFENGLTCLTVAAKGYDQYLVTYLLEHGAKVDEPTRELGQFKALTPLHFAAEWCLRHQGLPHSIEPVVAET
ncbi:hypothetical protein J4E80_008342 [Alternaria sp. BMP 0032]|nr:hypothetical protein J4E80_008342 [Alternaria sp. BMP 0032]